MIHGLDTGFLIAAEMQEHAEHAAARATIARLLAAPDMIAIELPKYLRNSCMWPPMRADSPARST
jgi:hypothetical protein